MARITLTTHWKFLRLARVVGGKVLARGILETLWEPCWLAGEAYCGTSQDIEALCEWKGAAGTLTQALLMTDGKSAGFIEPYTGPIRVAGATHYQIHDFDQHCPAWVKRRRQEEDGALIARVCKRCGRDYLAHRGNSRYCTQKCRQSTYRHAGKEDVTIGSRHPIVTPIVTPEPEVEGLEIPVLPPRLEIPPLPKGRVPSARELAAAERAAVRATEKAAVKAAKIAAREERDAKKAAEKAARAAARAAAQAAKPPKLVATNPPPPPLSVVLTFPVTGLGGPVWYLVKEQVAIWESLYPGLDILSESRRCLAWLQANPHKRKTYRGMANCLVNWFNRSVDGSRRGPTMITGSLKTAGNQAAVESWLRRRNALDQ